MECFSNDLLHHVTLVEDAARLSSVASLRSFDGQEFTFGEND